jgi:hypothetical protein
VATRDSRPSLVESMGLSPLRVRLRQAAVALRGAEDVPPSRFDRTSLAVLRPRHALPLWFGRFSVPRQVLLTNLFNHHPTPAEEGWSVRRTQTEDFRGRGLTYDSHNGTDLSVPRGSLAVAPAPGRVVRVYAEFNRGGLKVIIDHGEGLLTCSAHLARSLAAEGDLLGVGQPYALTGYSGLDGFATFPWGVPHIHFNVWLNGEPVDPFARPGETSLWKGGRPQPVPEDPAGEAFRPSVYDESSVEEVLAACRTSAVRDRLSSVGPLEKKAAWLIAETNYYPTRFPVRRCVQTREALRSERLYLPFLARDFDGAVFVDEI